MILINSITIRPKNITVTKDKWYYGLSAEICPVDATCKCLTWESVNPNIASVNQSGYICGVSEGTVVIRATAQDGSGAVDFCTVTVAPPVMVSSITVTPEAKTLNVGETFAISATICPDNATEKRVRWCSADTTIAEVDSTNGSVTAKSAGTTQIYATAIDGSETYNFCSVTVNNIPVTNITINPPGKTIVIDAITRLQAIITPSSATNKTIVWSSNDTNIATVNSLGVVTGKNPGSVTIKATAMDGSNVSASCTIIVNDLPDIDTDSWEDMGFVYGNNDSYNANHNLPPLAYQNWVAKGRQKAIYISDKSKMLIVGHAILLIRSTEGIWYKTQFAGPWLDKSEAKISCVPISELDKESLLNKSGVDYVYLYGDYTESLTKAKYYSEHSDNGYNGKYDLIGNNCLHYVNEILGYGININNKINNFIAKNLSCEPQVYYGCLVSIINGEDFLDEDLLI